MHEEDADSQPLSIRDRFPMMRPIDQVPTLLQVAGCGLGMSGRRGWDAETESFVSSHCLTLFFVPVWALAAYRVQRTPRGTGFYFLGRVPLTSLAWASNGLSSLVLVLIGCVACWWLTTGGAEMRAAARLADAQRFIGEGKLRDAATLLREVMDSRTSHAAEARRKLAELAVDPKGEHVEVAGLFRILADLEARGDPLVPDLFKRGYAYAESRKDPAEGLEVADVIAPLALFNMEMPALERRLLEALLQKKPGDPEAVSRLALVLDGLGESAQAEKLVETAKDKLGSLPGAAILGRVRLQQGRYAEAKALLDPVVADRLPGYRNLALAMQESQGAVWDKYDKLIQSRQAKGFDYAKYDAADQEGKDKLRHEYVNLMFPEEHRARIATNAAMRERPTLDAVLDLGLAEVHLAQKEVDPVARRIGLDQAERTFKSVQEHGNGHPAYMLRLGKVYYWLGKPDEGRRLFDDLLRNRKHAWEYVQPVASILRSVGASSEAREMLEAAYAREKDAHVKETIAYMRSQSGLDLDDRLLWLGRAGEGEVHLKIDRLLTRAQKARLEGKDAEAIKLCRECLAIYKGMGEESKSHNNHALAWFQLYELTRDKADFLAGIALLEKALDGQPSDPVILSNLAGELRCLAAHEAVEGIDFKALRQQPDAGHLAYLYKDEAGRARAVARFAAQPAIQKARSHLDRLLVLSPRQSYPYSVLGYLHALLGEREALARLLLRAEGANLDTADSVRLTKEHLEGAKDEKRREDVAQSVRRAEAALEVCRKIEGATHAAAACALSSRLMGLAVFDPTVDEDRVVKLAEEGHEAAESDATRSALAAALAFRAHVRLKKHLPEYAALCKRLDRALGPRLITWLALRGGPLGARVRDEADVKRAQAIRAHQVVHGSVQRSPATWAFLKDSHPMEAALIAERLRKDGAEADHAALEVLISPHSPGAVLDRVFALEVLGKPHEAAKLLREKAAAGVPLPEAP